MATFIVNCSHCGQALEADESWVGMELECPICKNNFLIPAPNTTFQSTTTNNISSSPTISSLRGKKRVLEENFTGNKDVLNAPSSMENSVSYSSSNIIQTSNQNFFKKYFLNVFLKKYCCFTGRTSIKEYWMFSLISGLIGLIGCIFVAVMTRSEELVLTFFALFACIIFLPGLGLLIRRLHDSNKSGWLSLIGLIPYLGGIVIFIFTLLPSSHGMNKYGMSEGEQIGSTNVESFALNVNKKNFIRRIVADNWITMMIYYVMFIFSFFMSAAAFFISLCRINGEWVWLFWASEHCLFLSLGFVALLYAMFKRDTQGIILRKNNTTAICLSVIVLLFVIFNGSIFLYNLFQFYER